MIKRFYVLAWFLLIAAALALALTGAFNAAALVAFSLVGLGLIYGFALWSVIVNTRETQPEKSS